MKEREAVTHCSHKYTFTHKADKQERKSLHTKTMLHNYELTPNLHHFQSSSWQFCTQGVHMCEMCAWLRVCLCFSSKDKEWPQIQCLIKYSSGHQRDSVYLCQSIALRYDIVLLLKTHPQSPRTDWEGNNPSVSSGKKLHYSMSWLSSTLLNYILNSTLFTVATTD